MRRRKAKAADSGGDSDGESIATTVEGQSPRGAEAGAQENESGGNPQKNESEDGMGENGREDEGGTEAEKELRRKKVEEIRRVAEGWRGRGGRRGSFRGTRSNSKTSLTASSDNMADDVSAAAHSDGASGEPARAEDGQLQLLMNEIDKQERPSDGSSSSNASAKTGGGLLAPLAKGRGQRGSILVLDEAAADLHHALKEQHQAMLEAEKTEEERKRAEAHRRREKTAMTGNEEVVHLRKQIDELMAANLALTRELQMRSMAAEAMQEQLAQAEAKRQEEVLLRQAIEKRLSAKLVEIESHTEHRLRSLLAHLKSQ